MWCAAGQDCKREGAERWVSDNSRHTFSGYGYHIAFHEECCPREFDGSRCTAYAHEALGGPTAHPEPRPKDKS